MALLDVGSGAAGGLEVLLARLREQEVLGQRQQALAEAERRDKAEESIQQQSLSENIAAKLAATQAQQEARHTAAQDKTNREAVQSASEIPIGANVPREDVQKYVAAGVSPTRYKEPDSTVQTTTFAGPDVSGQMPVMPLIGAPQTKTSTLVKPSASLINLGSAAQQETAAKDKAAADRESARQAEQDRKDEQLNRRLDILAKGKNNVNVNVATKDDIDSQADMLLSGDLVPSQMSKRSGSFNQILARANAKSKEQGGKGYSATGAELQFRAASAFARTQNDTQRKNFLALADSVQNTIGDVLDLSAELKQGGIQKYNAARRGTILQVYGNSPQSETAAKYVAAVDTLKGELANLIKQGAPDDASFKLAQSLVNSDYGVKDMAAALDEARRLIGFRKQAIVSQGPTLPQTPGNSLDVSSDPYQEYLKRTAKPGGGD